MWVHLTCLHYNIKLHRLRVQTGLMIQTKKKPTISPATHLNQTNCWTVLMLNRSCPVFLWSHSLTICFHPQSCLCRYPILNGVAHENPSRAAVFLRRQRSHIWRKPSHSIQSLLDHAACPTARSDSLRLSCCLRGYWVAVKQCGSPSAALLNWHLPSKWKCSSTSRCSCRPLMSIVG